MPLTIGFGLLGTVIPSAGLLASNKNYFRELHAVRFGLVCCNDSSPSVPPSLRPIDPHQAATQLCSTNEGLAPYLLVGAPYHPVFYSFGFRVMGFIWLHIGVSWGAVNAC